MILWKSKTTTETESKYDWGIRSWWKQLKVELNKSGFYIAFEQIVRFEKNGLEQQTGDTCSIWINKYFDFGSSHIYYDGTHCSFSIGFVHFTWYNPKCKKCLADGGIK